MTKSPLCFILMPFGTKANADGSLINFDRVYRGAPFLPLWRPAKALAITLCFHCASDYEFAFSVRR